MQILVRVLLCWIAFFPGYSASAQKSTFNTWFFSSHTLKLSEKWNFLHDIQIRSGPRAASVQTILLRPGIEYGFSKKHRVAAGYTYFGDREMPEKKSPITPEHRVWEQYKFELEKRGATFTHRLRLEQRFLPVGGTREFAQRLRVYSQLKIPFHRREDFTRGCFAVLQNEIFFNIQNRENINDHYFDQNRTLLSAGFRFNKKVDAEAGYLFRYQKDTDGNMNNNILQVVITTSF